MRQGLEDWGTENSYGKVKNLNDKGGEKQRALSLLLYQSEWISNSFVKFLP
jgi:hypothetical protein